MFDSGVMESSLVHEQQFLIKREMKNGKYEQRMLKLTADSVLSFKGKSIEREIPFSTIQSFYLDPEKKSTMYINYMNRVRRFLWFSSNKSTEQKEMLCSFI